MRFIGAMAQGRHNRNQDQDGGRVTLDSDAAVHYWTGRFDVSQAELEEAVDIVGDSVDAVAAYLNTGR